jgi:hypothetical protein
MNAEMIIDLKPPGCSALHLKRRPLLGGAAIEQLTDYDYTAVRRLHEPADRGCSQFGR